MTKSSRLVFTKMRKNSKNFLTGRRANAMSDKNRAPEFQGHVDGVVDDTIVGWIRRTDSEEPIVVDVYVEGRLHTKNLVSGLHRQDLVDNGIGAGRHGFAVKLSGGDTPCPLNGGLIEVFPAGSLEEASPGRRTRPLPLLTHVVSSPLGKCRASETPALYEGNIDICENGVLSGWIRMIGEESPRLIDVYIDQQLVAKALTANQFRSDLAEAGIGNGRYGFQLDVSDLVDRGSYVEGLVQIYPVEENLVPVLQRLYPKDAMTRAKRAPEYRITLDADIGGGHIRGWAIDTLSKGDIFNLEILIDGKEYGSVANDRPRRDLAEKGISQGLGGFETPFSVEALGPGRHQVAFRLPNGKLVEKAVENSIESSGSSYCAETLWTVPVSIIVPIYNAAEELKICIERLVAHTSGEYEVLLIDDASPDPRIEAILTDAEQKPQFRVLRNASNLGFSGTINRGIAETAERDVILLNSDARVTPGWLEGLRAAVHSSPRIATATPLSDRAGAFSAPNVGNHNPLPAGVDEISFARAVRRNSAGLYPLVPTGNGFCMYIRRSCINEVGVLDAEAFPRGYGEENDFCMRACRAGWRHVIDDRTYVFHERSRSFGASKTELIAQGRRIVDSRFPEYQVAIKVFSNSPEIQMARFNVRTAASKQIQGGFLPTRILFITSTTMGGTPQTNRDLMQALGGDIEGWILRCDSRMLYLSRMEGGKEVVIGKHRLSEKVDPLAHISTEYEQVVSNWILKHDFDIVHIRHLAWHSLSLPALVKRLQRKVVFSAHDFYMISPTIKLLDDDGEFLGTNFTPVGRSSRQSLWPVDSQPDPDGDWLRWWRTRSSATLLQCDALITTSDSARNTILHFLPDLSREKFHVIAHGRDFRSFLRLSTPYLQTGERIRILVPGNIDLAKGLKVIEELVSHDDADLIEFHVLGDIDRSRSFQHSRLIIHGKYNREDFETHVAAIRPHIGAVFSIWDETWCHTLTEMWSVGLPVAVFDMPTVASRVRRSGAGWVLDHRNIPKLYEQLIEAATDHQEQRDKDDAISRWQTGEGAARTTRAMAADYFDVYRSVLKDASIKTPRVAVVCPSNRDLLQANASTFIRIWERTRNSFDREVTYVRMTPESLLGALRIRAIDAAIIQRTAIPKTIARQVLQAFRLAEIPFIFELDDNLLAVPREKDPQGLYKRQHAFLHELLESAAVTTVSTEALRAELASVARSTVVIPNRLSGRLWRSEPSLRKEDGHVRALYMGTKTHLNDLKLILPALDIVAADYPNFRASLIGITEDLSICDGRERWLEIIEVPSSNRSYDMFVPWLKELASRFDFGLAPLDDSVFNSCKSNLKLLDYTGLGLPILASNHSVYRSFNHEIPCITYVENTVDSWIAGLRNLLTVGTRALTSTQQQLEWLYRYGFLEEEVQGLDSIVREILRKDAIHQDAS